MSKIVLITNNDFAGTLFLNRLIKYRLDVRQVYLVAGIRGNVVERIQRMGELCASRSLLFLWYRYLVERFLFRLLSVDGKSIKSIPTICRENNIGCERVRDVDEPHFVAKVRQAGDALVLSAFGTQKFSEALVFAADTIWNIHGSYLPYYRGAAPYFYMLMKDEHPRGVTIHELTPKLDQGKVIMQAVINPKWNESLLAYHGRCVIEAAELFVRAFQKYTIARTMEAGEPPKPMEQRPVVGLPRRADIREFRRRGKRFFYWNDFNGIKSQLN
jgi:folate-dependent phosphoribosylglycinamide formyltransferase PurN